MSVDTWSWVGFNLLVVVMLAIDQLVFHREAHEVKLREAVGWTILWVVLGVGFTGFIYYKYEVLDAQPAVAPLAEALAETTAAATPDVLTPDAAPEDHASAAATQLMPRSGREAAVMYLTGYLIEKSLSMDNLFVFLIIFSYFRVPGALQHRVLFWGILGALLFRAGFILAGIGLIHQFHWIIYLFGAFLVFTGVKLAFEHDKQIDPQKNPVLALLRRVMPVTNAYDGQRFFTRIDGRRFATPMFVTLIVIETTDVIFAVDSIPAILAISSDPFIVYTSNVFAILGLRAMYFALAAFLGMFAYLNYGLALILVFVGIKMVAVDFFRVPTTVSLAVVVLLLAGSVAASLLFPKRVAGAESQAETGSSRAGDGEDRPA